jgi:hypothetical protein
MKPNCPYCAEPVEPGALKCRSCGEALDKAIDTTPAVRVGSGDPFDPTDCIKWPFDDPDWVKKTLFGSLSMIIPFAVLVLMGYQVRIAREQRDHPGRRPMPEWDNIGDLVKDGFFFFVTVVLPPMLLLMTLGCVIGGGAYAMAASGGGGGGRGGPPPAFVLGMIAFEFAFIGLSFLYSYLVPAILMEYLETGSVLSSFRVGELWRRVTTVDYLILFLCDLVVGMLGGMGMVACYVGLFFTIPLSMYIRAGLIGRYLAREHARVHGLAT